MTRETLHNCLAILVFALIVACVFGLHVAIAEWKCGRRWGDSGMQSNFKVFAGCRVSLDRGKTWIPEDRYRVVEE